MKAYTDALAQDVDRQRRRGTWCPPTASGCATSPSREILRDMLERIDPQFPEPEDDIDGLVVT